MAIIVVLAGVSVPIVIGVMDNAKKSLAQSRCKELAGAVQAWIDDPRQNPHGDVPTSFDQIQGFNMESVRDPWGGEYHLNVPPKHKQNVPFDVSCDCGGSDEVGNWDN